MYQALVDFKYWTFIAQICNLFLQMLLFKKFLFKPVREIIEKRRQEVGEMYDQAEQARTTAESDKAAYAAKIQGAGEEAAQLLRGANERARSQEEAIIRQAEQKAQSMIAQADAAIEQERSKAMNDIKNDISMLAVDIAEKVVEREINPKDHEKLIEGFIAAVGDES